MPTPRSTSPDIPIRVRDRATRRAAWLVAAALRAGRSSANDAFDRFLPLELNAVSAEYWTPLPIVRRVAGWLRETHVRTVVDIGSGTGKFCVAGALLTRCHFIGLEQRASLIGSARGLAEIFDVADRVSFVHGDFGAVTTPAGDAYYLFNPFGEYFFNSTGFDEPDVAFSPDTYQADVTAVTEFLSRAPFGTLVITLNGFGGNFPPGYEQLDIDRTLSGTLRLLRQQVPPQGPVPTSRKEPKRSARIYCGTFREESEAGRVPSGSGRSGGKLCQQTEATSSEDVRGLARTAG